MLPVNMPIDLNSTFSLTAGCETSFAPDGIVIYQASREKIHHLSPTAAIVYRLCGENASVEKIIEHLKKTFSLQESPHNDVHQCIEQLLAEGLIVFR
jgi:hypothetical protein